jgi:hypothetical protein
MDKIRRRCRAHLKQLTLPDPFDLAELCQTVSAQRGRPLHVRGIPGPAARARPCGIWIATAEDDWIFVDQETSPLHRQHIVLHELAHMLCRHTSAELPENSMIAQLFPNLSPTMVTTVLSRTSYASEYEREAETLASLILARSQPAATPVMPVRDMSAAEAATLRRAGLALGLGP